MFSPPSVGSRLRCRGGLSPRTRESETVVTPHRNPEYLGSTEDGGSVTLGKVRPSSFPRTVDGTRGKFFERTPPWVTKMSVE